MAKPPAAPASRDSQLRPPPRRAGAGCCCARCSTGAVQPAADLRRPGGCAVGWLVGTTSGMNSIIALVNRVAPVQIEVRGSFGALTREFGFAELTVTVGNKTIDATAFRAALRDWHWQPLRLDFDHLQADALRVDVHHRRDPAPGHRRADSADRLACTLGSLTVVVDEYALQPAIDRRPRHRRAGRLPDRRRHASPSASTRRGRRRTRSRATVPARSRGRLSAQVQDKAVEAALPCKRLAGRPDGRR